MARHGGCGFPYSIDSPPQVEGCGCAESLVRLRSLFSDCMVSIGFEKKGEISRLFLIVRSDTLVLCMYRFAISFFHPEQNESAGMYGCVSLILLTTAS